MYDDYESMTRGWGPQPKSSLSQSMLSDSGRSFQAAMAEIVEAEKAMAAAEAATTTTTEIDTPQEDIWVEVGQPKLLTAKEALEVRRAARFWKVWKHEKKRPAICRECGEKILAGARRIGYKHVDIVTQTYDKQGFIHADERICRQNLELDSLFDQQMELLEAEGISPEMEEA